MRCSVILIFVPFVGLLIRQEALAQFLEPQCGLTGVADRIMGGTNALHGQFPWMAYLYQNENDFTCGGSLIHKREICFFGESLVGSYLIFTIYFNRICFDCCSLHCESGNSVSIIFYKLIFSLSIDNSYRPSSVRLGEYYTESRADSSTVYGVSMAFRNRLYNKAEHIHDIGLLRLDRDVYFNANIRPVCILTDSMRVPNVNTYTVTGWGKTSVSTSRTSAVLQMLELQDIDINKCYEHMGLQLNPGQICASNPRGDTCLGDSGGPLVHRVNVDGTSRYVQFGLVSYGLSVCTGPGVYTRVHHYVDWILRAVEYGLTH
ncbi:hypothetical protein KR054_000442 [Drosophila jambulina]|nr:hypothetical protein KR054_000442 [Drosophila jambulina]